MEIENDIPSEAKFSKVFKELSDLNIAQKTYLSDTILMYNATDATRIPLLEKHVKVIKEKKPYLKEDDLKK